MKTMLITGICWPGLVLFALAQAGEKGRACSIPSDAELVPEVPLQFTTISSTTPLPWEYNRDIWTLDPSYPTPLPAEHKRDVPISGSSGPPTPTTATPQLIGIRNASPSTTSPSNPNLTLGTQVFTPAPAETAFVFSGEILAASHALTLVFTSKTCTQNPVVSITASLTTLPQYGINSDYATVGTSYIRCMVFASGSRSSTYSAEGTGGWGSGQEGLVWTFTDRRTRGESTTQSPWQSATRLWINPIPTTLPRYVVSSQTVAFTGPAVSQSAEQDLQARITTDSNGSGWLVAGSDSVTVPGWPLITPGPVAGSDFGGAYPGDDRPAGGAALIETGCCNVCQNATQIPTTPTTASGKANNASWSRRSAIHWPLFLLVWVMVQLQS